MSYTTLKASKLGDRFKKRYKDRIIALHLQDNDGIAQELMEDGLAALEHDKHAQP